MTRQAYLRAGEVALELLGNEAVARAWDRPSALARMDVGTLAAHLARQITRVTVELDAPAPPGPPVTLADHFGRAHWLGQGADHEVNVGIRRRSEEEAAAGAEAVLTAARGALAQHRRRLPSEPADRLVPMPLGALTLDDFLVTRLLEITVHCDDLAVSVGVDTPALPPEVTGPVLELLCQLAVRRHGLVAVLRTLSRAERAPATISAL